LYVETDVSGDLSIILQASWDAGPADWEKSAYYSEGPFRANCLPELLPFKSCVSSIILAHYLWQADAALGEDVS
jgi:hypothetical protein